MNGPEREAEIQRIKSRGILDVKDRNCLDRLAANVFNNLWIKVEASIDEIIRSSDLNSGKTNPTFWVTLVNLMFYRLESTAYSIIQDAG